MHSQTQPRPKRQRSLAEVHDSKFVSVQRGDNGAFSIVARDTSDPAAAAADDTRTVDIAASSGAKKCVGQCGAQGKWRYATREYICEDCAQHPPHKLITRTHAKTLYGLSFEDLHQAMMAKRIRMFTVKNYHNAAAPPIRLYYVHELEALAQALRRHTAH